MSKVERPDDRAPVPAKEREGEERFLSRWSRRKQESQTPPAPLTREEAPAESDKAPVKVLTDADMPPLESLDENSDFSLFMSVGVSDELRRRALRKLFTLPAINQRCPLDSEYVDCHGFEPLGDIITHDMREEMERAALKLKESVKEALLEDEPAAVAGQADSGAPVPANGADPSAPAATVASDAADSEDKLLRGHPRPRRAPEENDV